MFLYEVLLNFASEVAASITSQHCKIFKDIFLLQNVDKGGHVPELWEELVIVLAV